MCVASIHTKKCRVMNNRINPISLMGFELNFHFCCENLTLGSKNGIYEFRMVFKWFFNINISKHNTFKNATFLWFMPA